ncbi:MAG TPA: anaerobic ribonucleoside-triphosphate reductase activating protein [Mollicutes bacterium]|jgi:pyruvate formate lyase activating enzyme|nr:anaerobic ribonucleoside-triphosphate reductase activating protein [Mollicutes bacterium]
MIAGINPISYNDFPKEISYVIFLGGCNFRCPFCHNSSIVDKRGDEIKFSSVVDSLIERKNFIKAVVITGGEPTIYGDRLISMIKTIKGLGFKIKLDTNGTNPSVLEKILDEGIIDYIAMDIKNTFDKYAETIGCEVDLKRIKQSIKIIEDSNIEYEFRTTINKKNHTTPDIEEIITYIKDKNKYFIQNYQYSKEQICKKDFGRFEEDELNKIKQKLDVGIKV